MRKLKHVQKFSLYIGLARSPLALLQYLNLILADKGLLLLLPAPVIVIIIFNG